MLTASVGHRPIDGPVGWVDFILEFCFRGDLFPAIVPPEFEAGMLGLQSFPPSHL